MKHKKITKTERELLNQWKSEGLSNIECAKRLGRSKATGWSPEQISGRLMEQDHPGESHWQICMGTIYQLIYKEKTDQTKQGLKQSRILDKRLPDGKACITVTDYDCPLWEFLRRKQKKRRKKGGRKVQKVRIPDRVSIHDRPKAVAKRKQFGHWEGDSICRTQSYLRTSYRV